MFNFPDDVRSRLRLARPFWNYWIVGIVLVMGFLLWATPGDESAKVYLLYIPASLLLGAWIAAGLEGIFGKAPEDVRPRAQSQPSKQKVEPIEDEPFKHLNMDIKNLLNKEVENVKWEKAEKEIDEVRKEREAKERFLPVAKAMHQFAEELSGHEDITLYISDHHVDINLGEKTKLKIHRDSWTGFFYVDVRNNMFEHPEYDVNEGYHHFDTADDAISFLIKETAKYVASKQT